MSLLGSLGKLAGGFLTGGPAGLAAAGLSIIAKKPTSQALPTLGLLGGPGSGIYTQPGGSKTGTVCPPGTSCQGASSDGFCLGSCYPIGGAGGGTMTIPSGIGGACPVGFKLNKSTYVTRGGGTSRWPQSLQVHPKNSTCVKRRRRNVGNARALRRAISRVKGFVKLARKAHALVGSHRSKTKRLGAGQNIEIVRG